jgi:hypothetical protein
VVDRTTNAESGSEGAGSPAAIAVSSVRDGGDWEDIGDGVHVEDAVERGDGEAGGETSVNGDDGGIEAGVCVIVESIMCIDHHLLRTFINSP